MKVAALRFRPIGDNLLFSDESGQFFRTEADFLSRYALRKLTPRDLEFLLSNGHAYNDEEDFYFLTYLKRLAARWSNRKKLSYLILVPTLRCNLSCSYCQVSRVAERASGFDWDNNILNAVIQFLDGLETEHVKIEFQGGEPTLRLDLLREISNFCERRFSSAEFVVCTNLQRVQQELLDYISKDNVYISTSLDGTLSNHELQRTRDPALTKEFDENLRLLLSLYGPEKISALPTIDYMSNPNIQEIVETFAGHGFRSIYLRPVNFQGFARKTHTHSKEGIAEWNRIYLSYIDYLVRYNWEHKSWIEDYYFTLCLRRVLRSGLDHHVDLRNPNFIGQDYIVIDYDGRLYPTDEARMLTRSGQIDLSIGDVHAGIATSEATKFNASTINNFHEECTHCAFQPFCGSDLVDDISRYGRIDLPKHETWFCQRHLAIFDKVFEFLYSSDDAVNYSVARWLGLPPGRRAQFGVTL